MQSDASNDTDLTIKAAPEAEGCGDAPDPDFPIEGGGGPIDDGGQVRTASPPPQ